MLKPTFTTEQHEDADYGKFILSPLPAGFGHTIGNALRRTLLSSMPGLAATYVKINDVVHPFSTTKGVKESTLDMILNLKGIRCKADGEGPFTLTFSGKGKQKVYAKDLKGTGIEVVNKDQYIAEITDDKTKLEIEVTVEKGVGYSPSEEKEKKEFGTLSLDSVFTPVKKVNYTIEAARVGRKTNYDKLTCEIWTDGSLSPVDAFKQSSQLMADFFNHAVSEESQALQISAAANLVTESRKVDKKVYQTIIDELDLPTRVINALLREHIETIDDLLKTGRENLVNLKGVGRKSLDLIEKELEKLGVSFDQV